MNHQEPRKKQMAKGEDLSEFRKAWFETDRQSKWLSRSFSNEVEVLQKKLKRNIAHGEQPKL